MRALLISLQLWVVTACTGGVASPPPGQPSAPETPQLTDPVTTTLEDTEEQLREEIARTGPTQRDQSITAWLRLLRDVPADARWRLGPSIVARR